jgi:hypothetical protein
MDSANIIAACLSSKNGDCAFYVEFGNKEDSPKIRDLIWYTVEKLFNKLFGRYVKFALGGSVADDITFYRYDDITFYRYDDITFYRADDITFYRYDGEKEPNIKIRSPKIVLQDDKIIVEMYVQILTANYDIWPIENFCVDVIKLIELIKNVKNIGEFDELVHVYNAI